MFSKKKILALLVIFLVICTITSCAAGSNTFLDSGNSDGYVAGFWRGLWHGFILLFSFVVSLFNKSVNIYEIHNSGALYNLGYLVGVSIFFSGSGSAGKRNKCK